MAKRYAVRGRRGRARGPGLAAAALLAVWVAAAGGAQAQGVASGGATDGGEVYGLRWAVDVPWMVASGLVGSSWLLSSELEGPACAPRCDARALSALDRAAAGRYDLMLRRVSDVGVALVLAGSSVGLLADGGLVDFAIGAQAVLATSAVAVLSMMAVRRPRPFVYGDEAPRSAQVEGNASLAFPSGHTANAFAATTALFHALRLRRPHSAWPLVALAGGCALSSAVGVTRVLAGDHFPSDVLAGAVLGAAIGWLVPELHRLQPSVSVAPSAGVLAVSGSW
jgi:membrane-associated phospholipid phosphatase